MCNDSNLYHKSTDFVSNSIKQSNFPTRTVTENKLIQSKFPKSDQWTSRNTSKGESRSSWCAPFDWLRPAVFQISIKNRFSSSAKRRRWETRKRQIRVQRIEESRSYRKPQKAGSQIRVRIAENAKVPSFPFSNGCLDSKIFFLRVLLTYGLLWSTPDRISVMRLGEMSFRNEWAYLGRERCTFQGERFNYRHQFTVYYLFYRKFLSLPLTFEYISNVEEISFPSTNFEFLL